MEDHKKQFLEGDVFDGIKTQERGAIEVPERSAHHRIGDNAQRWDEHPSWLSKERQGPNFAWYAG